MVLYPVLPLARRLSRWLLLICALLLALSPSPAQAAGSYPYYGIGNPSLIEVYVSPTGNDGASGSSRSAPLRTIGAAWERIPTGPLTGSGYRINLLPGVYPCEGDCLNYFADRAGSWNCPIILRAADGPGTVTLLGGLNLNNVSYLYLMDLKLWAGQEAGAAFGNNVLHIEGGDHILLRRLTLRGPLSCLDDSCNDMQEVLKVNQSRHVYVEQSDLAGTYQSVLDFFSVQHGHLLDNQIHHGGGRCAYLKGGSAYFLVAGNELDHCGEAGFQAGEGSNLAFMRPPWLHYEAYDIKVVNNVVHDIYGAGLSVSGGYNILMAYNTLYRVGLDDPGGRNWSLAQCVHGWRGCVPADEYGGDDGTRARCASLLNQGGWGTSALGDDNGGDWIPNRNIYIYNNVSFNPAGTGTHYVQFVVNGSITPPAQARNLPSPSRTDDNLVIRGNVIWNRTLEGSELVGDNNGSGAIGCLASNPACNPTQLRAQNRINTLQPQLRDPAHGDFRPTAGGNLFAVAAVSIPAFTWGDAPALPSVPAGALGNAVLRDRDGVGRRAGGPPGAYGGAAVRISSLPLVLKNRAR